MGFKRNVFGEQIVAVPVPQIGEPVGEVVQLAPRERVQSRTPEQIMDFPVPQNMEVYAIIVRAPSTGVRAESYAGSDRGCSCTSDHGGCRGSCA